MEEVYEVNLSGLRRRVKVVALLHNRVGAKEVSKYMQDLTPEEEYERMRSVRECAFEVRDNHIGRPTKRDRRRIETFKGDDF